MKTLAAALIATIPLAIGPPAARAEHTLIDLDTAPGNYSVWRVTDLKASSIAFIATFAKVQKHERWAPRYAVTLSDGKGHSVVFGGTYVGSKTPQASVTLLGGGTKTVLSAESILMLNLEEHYTVRLEWTDGSVKVTVNGKQKEYKIGFAPSEIEISSSTGELEVKDIQFGA